MVIVMKRDATVLAVGLLSPPALPSTTFCGEGVMVHCRNPARGRGQCDRCGRFLSIRCAMSTRKRGSGGKKGPDVCFIPSLPDGCCIRMMDLMGDEASCKHLSSSSWPPLPAPVPRFTVPPRLG